jgi:hypothetical protein
MDSSVSLKDQIWFLRVCRHVSNGLYNKPVGCSTSVAGRGRSWKQTKFKQTDIWGCIHSIAETSLTFILHTQWWSLKHHISVFFLLTVIHTHTLFQVLPLCIAYKRPALTVAMLHSFLVFRVTFLCYHVLLPVRKAKSVMIISVLVKIRSWRTPNTSRIPYRLK